MNLLMFLLVLAVVAAIVAIVLGRMPGGMPEPSSTVPQVRLPDGGFTGDDVNRLRFVPGLRGYRMDQVDEAIDRLAAEIDRLRALVLAGAPQSQDDVAATFTRPEPAWPAPDTGRGATREEVQGRNREERDEVRDANRDEVPDELRDDVNGQDAPRLGAFSAVSRMPDPQDAPTSPRPSGRDSQPLTPEAGH